MSLCPSARLFRPKMWQPWRDLRRLTFLNVSFRTMKKPWESPCMITAIDMPSLAFIPKPALDAPNKQTIIRIRWMIVIASCYLLLFPQDALLGQGFVHGFTLVYVVSNASLYFLDQRRFESFSFFSTLVIFDTLALTFSLVVTGQLGSDLYLTYFLLIIIAGFWKDFRWSLAFASLISVLYSYLLFIAEDPNTYMFLRIPFLFIASVFYGYFAQTVSAERTRREKAEEDARKDFLTGLPNRQAFDEKMREEIERATRYDRPLSLLIIDIDNFKTVNDSLGHQWGDVVLQGVAELMKRNIRPPDFVARVGGEEFVVVLPETELLGAVEVGNRLRIQIKECPFETPKGLLIVTVSVGVSVNLIGDQKQLFCDADQALYIAKHGGKDRVAALPGNISGRPTVLEASQ